jgi:hypothetical protein
MDTAYPDEIDGIIGTVPPRLMREIIRRVADQGSDRK